MQQVHLHPPPDIDFDMPPTEDDLPYDDGMPMESHNHARSATLLTEPLRFAWKDRANVFIASNMFVYFSPDQVRTSDFRGPDVFVALDVPNRARKSFVVWQEQKGPDVVIELLSDKTAAEDKTVKKAIYAEKLRVPEYFWFHPLTGEFAGFILQGGVYQPIVPDSEGRLRSERLDLLLVRWDGVYHGIEGTWLRWAAPEGTLLPTDEEIIDQERLLIEELRLQLARYQERFGQLPE